MTDNKIVEISQTKRAPVPAENAGALLKLLARLLAKKWISQQTDSSSDKNNGVA